MGSYLTHTVSGTNFVQVKTIEESPIENLKIHFLPKQEGSGTPAPDNVRNITGWTGTNVWFTGENIAEFVTNRLTKTIDYNGYIGFCNELTNLRSLSGEKVTYSVTIDATNQKTDTENRCKVWGKYTDGSWAFLGTAGNVVEKGESGISLRTITIPDNLNWIAFGLSLAAGAVAENPMVVFGETAADYEAYHADTLSISSLYVRKNLFDPTQCNKTASNNIRPYYDHPITLYPGTYTMSCDEECNGIYVNEGQTALFTAYHATSLTFTLSAAKTVWFNFYKEGGFATDTTVQLEIGDTATTHVAYNALSPFQNTIYGGYIDFATGNIYAEYAEVLNTTWSNTTYTTTLTNVERRSFDMAEDNLVLPNTGNTGKYCNVAPWSWDWNADRVHFYTAPNTQTAVVFLPLNTAEDTHIQIVQPYINPVLIGQIVPISFKTKAGIMNISSDVTNTIECTYRFTDYLAPRRILINTPHIETVSNNLATFDTDLAANIKSLKCSFTPQQSGSGDPYAPGGGKNKWNGTFETKTQADMTWTANSDGTITVSGTPSAYSAIISDYFAIDTQETICISGDLSNVTNVAGDNIVLYDENKDTIATIEGGWTQYKVIDMSNYPTAKYITISFKRTANNVASSGTIKPMLELSSAATSYAPYSNVRPITGHSDITGYINTHAYNINFPVLGDNLFDKSTGMELHTKNLRVARNRGAGKGVPFLMKAGVTYTVYCNSTTTPTEIDLMVPYVDTEIIRVYNTDRITYTPEEDIEVSINMYWHETNRPADATDIMVKIGTTKTPFHPYFKIADGYINLITGELVVNSVLLTYNTAAMNNLESYPGWAQSSVAQIVGTNLDKTYWHNNIINIGETFSVNTKYSDILFIPKSVYGFTQTEWQALAMDVQICVQYATPQVIQLTPQQIKTIKGSNTIYSSTGDNVSVEYWTH